jgi:hypothetical protein
VHIIHLGESQLTFHLPVPSNQRVEHHPTLFLASSKRRNGQLHFGASAGRSGPNDSRNLGMQHISTLRETCQNDQIRSYPEDHDSATRTCWPIRYWIHLCIIFLFTKNDHQKRHYQVCCYKSNNWTSRILSRIEVNIRCKPIKMNDDTPPHLLPHVTRRSSMSPTSQTPPRQQPKYRHRSARSPIRRL